MRRTFLFGGDVCETTVGNDDISDRTREKPRPNLPLVCQTSLSPLQILESLELVEEIKTLSTLFDVLRSNLLYCKP